MRPRVIMHNTVSVDGSLIGFDPDLGLHYTVAGGFGAGAHLIGSGTLVVGLETYGEPTPETDALRRRPEIRADDERPIWVIPDSRGQLQGRLHALRGFEHCKDVVVLVSRATPAGYLGYLDEREYLHHRLGEDHVELEGALELLAAEYGVSTVLTDAGPTLDALLLDAGLVDEISLIVAPLLVGPGGSGMFARLGRDHRLEPIEQTAREGGAIHCRYRVLS
jgi:2,5-diamino-6-(ribosylamino)-4(3H)-pyrimidinone 5'-phosphate reductase